MWITSPNLTKQTGLFYLSRNPYEICCYSDSNQTYSVVPCDPRIISSFWCGEMCCTQTAVGAMELTIFKPAIPTAFIQGQKQKLLGQHSPHSNVDVENRLDDLSQCFSH